MKKLTTSVFAERNGSRYAVVGSGNSDMSDSWIAWKPRIDEPSKLRPSSNTDWSNEETGTVKCCITPGKSQNRTSTISTPSSLMYFSSSSLFANIRPPGSWRTVSAPGCAQNRRAMRLCTTEWNLCSGSFSGVSGLFRACNGMWERLHPALAPCDSRGAAASGGVVSQSSSPAGTTAYVGQRLGLPEHGPGSVA